MVPKARNPNIDKAKDMFDKGAKLIEIASQLNVPEGTVRSWKNRYKWNRNATGNNRNVANKQKRKRGGQPGNKNGKGALPGNKNAEKHGFYSRYLPKETLELFENASLDPIDMLWENILLARAAIIRAQKIAYVKNSADKTIERIGKKNGDSIVEERWEVQQAWDKQATFMNAQSRAQRELGKLIKQYDEMVHKNWDLVTEEQKARLELLKAKTDNADEVPDDGFLEALSGKVDEIWQEE